eukprot:TRINITY_DN6494_c1_g2_i1.p2 TRINITY_DN6494_c1_g2~~TRINITY_DN6494_c1_g2_i1.p2  ORF type:complete len:485 (+),score=233.72 TRINITY_DN6494_c1_g2_i1:159-1457(+)
MADAAEDALARVPEADPAWVSHAAGALAGSLLGRGAVGEAEDVMRRAVARSDPSDLDTWLRCTDMLGVVLCRGRGYEEAERLLSVAAAAAAGHPLECKLRLSYGSCLLLMGRPADALPHLRFAADLLDSGRPASRQPAADALRLLRSALMDTGDAEQAVTTARRHLELAREGGDAEAVQNSVVAVVMALTQAMRFGEARAALREVESADREDVRWLLRAVDDAIDRAATDPIQPDQARAHVVTAETLRKLANEGRLDEIPGFSDAEAGSGAGGEEHAGSEPASAAHDGGAAAEQYAGGAPTSAAHHASAAFAGGEAAAAERYGTAEAEAAYCDDADDADDESDAAPLPTEPAAAAAAAAAPAAAARPAAGTADDDMPQGWCATLTGPREQPDGSVSGEVRALRRELQLLAVQLRRAEEAVARCAGSLAKLTT